MHINGKNLNKRTLLDLKYQLNIIKKNISIPDFNKTGFPFIIAYILKCKIKPTTAINNYHTNNCYRIFGEEIYFIEAIFKNAWEVEAYDELIKKDSDNFIRYHLVDDIRREDFIPQLG